MAFNTIEYMAVASVQALIMTLVVGAMLRVWHVAGAQHRILFWLPVLVLPALALPFYRWLWPAQHSLAFKQRFAVLDVGAWLEIGLWRGLAVWHVAALALGVATVLFLVQEVLPGLRHHVLERGRHTPIRRGQFPKLDAALDRLSVASSRPLPAVGLCQREQPTAYACGLLHSRLAVSPSLLEMLDEDELEACLAHELAHVRRCDNWTGWLFLALRAVQFYSPVALVVTRHMLQENERACDDMAAAMAGKPEALASSLAKLCRDAESHDTPVFGSGWRGWVSSRLAALDAHAWRTSTQGRVASVLQPRHVGVTYLGLRWGLCLVALAVLQALVP